MGLCPSIAVRESLLAWSLVLPLLLLLMLLLMPLHSSS